MTGKNKADIPGDGLSSLSADHWQTAKEDFLPAWLSRRLAQQSFTITDRPLASVPTIHTTLHHYCLCVLLYG